MKIQELAQKTGVSAKTIRYYEEIGILPAPARAENNYREYGEQDVARLRLVAGARRLDLCWRKSAKLLPCVTAVKHPAACCWNVWNTKPMKLRSAFRLCKDSKVSCANCTLSA